MGQKKLSFGNTDQEKASIRLTLDIIGFKTQNISNKWVNPLGIYNHGKLYVPNNTV